MDPKILQKTVNDALDEKLSPVGERLNEIEKKMAAQDKKIEPMIIKGQGDDAWKETFGKELKDIMTGQKTVVTLSDLEGAVPETWVAEVFRIPCDYGAFLQSNPRPTPMAEAIHIAKKHASTNVSLTWTSQGSGEGIEERVTEGKTGEVTGDRDTLIASVPLSRQSVRYSNVQLVNYFTDRLREEWNGELDDQAINGNTNPFVGILNTSGVHQVVFDTGQNEFKYIARKYIIRAVHKVNSSVLGSAGWFIHNAQLGTIHEYVVDANNRPLFDYQRNMLMGFPVWVTEKAPNTDGASKDMMVFGSPRIGMVYATEGFEVAVSEHAEFKKNNIVLRVTVDVIIAVVLEKAFCKITTHS